MTGRDLFEWTDALTGRVNMMARWYNTDTGQFDTRDSASNSPVPDSVAANRFQYGDGNPLLNIDPTGHSNWFTKAVNAGVNVVSNKWSETKRKTEELAAAARAKYEAAKARTMQLAAAARAKAERMEAAARAKYQAAKAWAKKAASKAKKAWNVVKNTTVRWVKKKANQVKDAYHSAKKCLSGGVGKCVKETAKKAAKKAVDTVKSTVEAIRRIRGSSSPRRRSGSPPRWRSVRCAPPGWVVRWWWVRWPGRCPRVPGSWLTCPEVIRTSPGAAWPPR